MPIYQVAPNRWTNRDPNAPPPARSPNLPLPYVISDEMPPTEQVDGKFYTSKAKFRAVGRANGLTEVGTEKPKPRTRPWRGSYENTKKRREVIGKSLAEFKMGRRI